MIPRSVLGSEAVPSIEVRNESMQFEHRKRAVHVAIKDIDPREGHEETPNDDVTIAAGPEKAS